MTTIKTLLFGVAQSCLSLCFVSTTLLAGENRSIQVKSINKVSEKVDQVDLGGRSMRVTTGTTSRVLEVDLTVTENRCRIEKHLGCKTVERDLTLWCYELCAKGEEVPYARAIWTSRPVKGFHLFSDTQGQNYLAWVDGTSVRIEDVSESRGMSDALVSYLSKSDRYTVPVTHLVGREPFEGLDAIHSDIDIVSVRGGKTGRLQLIVRAPKTGELFEFAFDGEAWNRLAR